MDSASHDEEFKEFYSSNKGRIYRSFEICIDSHRYAYDIYWGDARVIFDPRSLKKVYPLAVTVIPRRNDYPNPRIFIHEMLGEEYGAVFEMVVTHEIGHLWLHDIVGFNNPCTNNTMQEKDSESWADYFSYCFFRKYRKATRLSDFTKVLVAATKLQAQVYEIDQSKISLLGCRAKDFELFHEHLRARLSVQDSLFVQMCDAVEITLSAVGNIFAM